MHVYCDQTCLTLFVQADQVCLSLVVLPEKVCLTLYLYCMTRFVSHSGCIAWPGLFHNTCIHWKGLSACITWPGLFDTLLVLHGQVCQALCLYCLTRFVLHHFYCLKRFVWSCSACTGWLGLSDTLLAFPENFVGLALCLYCLKFSLTLYCLQRFVWHFCFCVVWLIGSLWWLQYNLYGINECGRCGCTELLAER